MCLKLLSCLVLVKQTFSDKTALVPRADGSSIGATCTSAANLVQRAVEAFEGLVAEEGSPDIQRREDAQNAVGSASKIHSSVGESSVDEGSAKPGANSSGEVRQIGAQSTFAATPVSNDSRLASPSEPRGRKSEDAEAKDQGKSPAISPVSPRRTLHAHSDEVRPEDHVEIASTIDDTGFFQTVLPSSQLVLCERIVGALGLHLRSGHTVWMVLLMSLIIVLVMCAIIFLGMKRLGSQWVRPDAGTHMPSASFAALSARSSPDASTKSLPLASARGPSASAKIHLCPELIVPLASECVVVVLQLSARILMESEATLTIQDTKGNRIFRVSQSTSTPSLPDRSHRAEPSSLRLSLSGARDNETHAFCEVRHHSHTPGAVSVVFQDTAGRYFAELEPCTKEGIEDQYKVSTTQGWYFYWRGTTTKTAVDSTGRLIAAASPSDSDATRHILTAGAGVDMGLVILSLMGTGLLAEIG